MTAAVHPIFALLSLLDIKGVRLFVGSVPQGVPLPYGRVTAIFGEHREHMDGPSGLAQARLQIDWWDTDPTRFNQTIETARMRLSGVRGPVDTDQGSLEVRRIMIVDGEVDADHGDDGSGEPILHSRQDYRVDYKEAV